MNDIPCSALVSIIMPVYNGQKYIGEAIQSVLNQTHTFWELIIINDGSDDNTKQIIDSFSDFRIRYFEQRRSGVSKARNRAMAEMKGDFFCFLDADDFFPSNSIKARLNKFIAFPNLAFVDGVVEVLDSTLQKSHRVYWPCFSGNPLHLLLQISEKCFFGLSWMIRRQDREYKMKENLTHGEDLLFYMLLSRDNERYDYVNETVLLYRRHQASAMQNLKKLQDGYRAIYQEIKNWPEFTFSLKVFYQFKTRKSMFLAFLMKGKFIEALGSILMR